MLRLSQNDMTQPTILVPRRTRIGPALRYRSSNTRLSPDQVAGPRDKRDPPGQLCSTLLCSTPLIYSTLLHSTLLYQTLFYITLLYLDPSPLDCGNFLSWLDMFDPMAPLGPKSEPLV